MLSGSHRKDYSTLTDELNQFAILVSMNKGTDGNKIAYFQSEKKKGLVRTNLHRETIVKQK